MALTCPACGAQAGDSDRFCEACGEEIPAPPAASPAAAPTPAAVTPCPACGATDPPVDGYCAVCGIRLPTAEDHVEVEAGKAAGVSDRGHRHPTNEDAVALLALDTALIAVVCDGVSSTVGAADAARAAVGAAVDAAKNAGDDRLLAAYSAARDAVAALVPADPADPPASCTFLAAEVAGGTVTVANLGDCRAYWIGADGVRLLTRDHSWAQEQIDAGALSPTDAFADPRCHTITRWLGRDADPAWQPTLSRLEPAGGRLLLCSDGLWMHASGDPADLLDHGAGGADRLEAARTLVRFANDAGGEDNVTVVIADLEKEQP